MNNSKEEGFSDWRKDLNLFFGPRTWIWGQREVSVVNVIKERIKSNIKSKKTRKRGKSWRLDFDNASGI